MYQIKNNRKRGGNLKLQQLGDLTEVMVGLVLKRKEADPNDLQNHKYNLLTLRSFNQEGWIDKNYLDEFESSEKLDDRYLCLNDDVVIRLTQPYTAVVIDKNFEGCVVPSQFAIVRPKSKKIISNYLSLYLNSDRVKKHITLSATGITVPMIKTGSLRELKIPIFTLTRQNKIAEVNKLIIKERHLLYKMISEKEKFYQALTEVILTEDKKDE